MLNTPGQDPRQDLVCKVMRRCLSVWMFSGWWISRIFTQQSAMLNTVTAHQPFIYHENHTTGIESEENMRKVNSEGSLKNQM